MEPFNLQSHLDEVYAAYPEAPYRPLIGITSNYTEGDASLRDRYYQQVVAAGGVPVVIPPVATKEVLVNTVDHLDGLLLSGGADYNPLWGGEEPIPGLHGINSERDLPELLITRLAYNRQLPILGICRGIQTLAMALGGKVTQDIGLTDIKHSQESSRRSEPTHSVSIIPSTELSNLYPEERILVNSFHHQAVVETGTRFRVSATAPDGVIEAMESTEHKPILGVQWHPEWMESGLPLFQWLVQEATIFHRTKELHRRILTLDTHCDTPMFFPKGIHFEQRDPHILVDLHKMSDGRQDAVIMVAYLPQPKIGEQFSQKVDVSWCHTAGRTVTPSDYADLIFDRIEDIVGRNNRYLSIARTPADLYEDKRKGRKSIMLGIENGLALNHDLENLKHFALRGVVYITLCHNGDNDICDSARGCNTHNGVSQFGEQVIQRMNQLGMMVDLSHAGEKSFYDALEISSTPIVCSHSNCKALCDVPRNLSDDQLRALAKKGGVAQITLYNGFLRKEGEASIHDAIQHLEHAIDVMGIDHVGLGSDFDGDGGIRGLADSSEMLNFTRQLLRRKYSDRDIEKIWGGNWLRVVTKVQRYAMLLLLPLLLFASCKSNKSVSVEDLISPIPVGPVFNADSAFAFCEAQCQFGPRTMNSKAHDDCGQWIAGKFRQYGCEVATQQAELKGYDGTPLKSTNIIAAYKPEMTTRILLCAHWDSRPWADNDPDENNRHTPVMAANDGASGVAVMLELARLMQHIDTLKVGIDFICFDAEDWGVPQWETNISDTGDSWALGAQYWARNLHRENYEARYGILLDMVGGQGAHFYQEGMSLRYAPVIVKKVWAAAKVVGYGSYFTDSTGGYITDDHIPVNEDARIPCIDIIPYYPDCQQSTFGPTWHTVADDMQHIDRNTLSAVGQTLIQVLFSEK